MLDLSRMTPGDAKQTLQVFEWIKLHLSTITALAEDSQTATSLAEAQTGFFKTFTCLESTRFMPLTVSIHTDEDALKAGQRAKPNIIVFHPLDEEKYLIAEAASWNLSEIGAILDIGVDERTWRKVEA